MRRALDGNPFISTVFAEPGYGYFGKHAGYDYGIKEWAVKAPEAGYITNVRIAPNLEGGNIVELRSDRYDHRFLHLKSASVSKGQNVAEGQELGISGNTGNVGYHLHHDVRKRGTLWTDSFSNYYDWESIIKQGGKKMLSEDDFYKLFRGMLGRDPTPEEAKSFTRDPATAINTLWNNGGQVRYESDKTNSHAVTVDGVSYEKKG